MLSYNVIMEDFNNRKIIVYDILKSGYWIRVAKELKDKFPTYEKWSDEFRLKLQSKYWARSEYEVVVTSWPPYIMVENIEKLNQEVEDREKTWGSKPLKVNITPTVRRKFDVFEQLDMNWEVFSNYVWNNV